MKKLYRGLIFLFRKLVWFLLTVFHFLARLIRAINKKKRYTIPFYSFVGYFLLVFFIIKFSGDPEYKEVVPNKRINDITAINPIQIGKEIQPETISEIVEAIKSTTGPISI